MNGIGRGGPALVLVGAPGSGKSTVGRLVANRLGVGFRDTDADIEQAAGKTITEIFAESGESGFRALEREAVYTAVAEHHGVLALGGGAVMDRSVRKLLRDLPVAFLDIGLAEAAARVGLNRDRPLLLGNVRGQLKKLLDARRPLYEEVATVTVATDSRPAGVVAEQVALAMGLVQPDPS